MFIEALFIRKYYESFLSSSLKLGILLVILKEGNKKVSKNKPVNKSYSGYQRIQTTQYYAL